jgi:AbrB family looped-hinge helix DNA binding protein
MAAKPATVRMGPRGRIVVPARLRRQLGVEEGSVLLARVEGDRLVLETQQAALDRLRGLFAHVPDEVSLVDELIAERRENARRENAE